MGNDAHLQGRGLGFESESEVHGLLPLFENVEYVLTSVRHRFALSNLLSDMKSLVSVAFNYVVLPLNLACFAGEGLINCCTYMILL